MNPLFRSRRQSRSLEKLSELCQLVRIDVIDACVLQKLPTLLRFRRGPETDTAAGGVRPVDELRQFAALGLIDRAGSAPPKMSAPAVAQQDTKKLGQNFFHHAAMDIGQPVIAACVMKR